MKRGGPLRRTTPLRAKAQPSPRPAGERPPTRPARAVTGPSDDTRALVIRRAAMRCEVCGDLIDRQPYSVHHRKPRRMGGTKDPAINLPSNLLVVCGSGTTGCHGRIESNRRWAAEAGYLVSSLRDPAETPVLLRGTAWRLLTDDGRYSVVPNPG